MKFTCDAESLAYALKKCMMLVAKSSTYPFTANFLLETVGEKCLKVTSTDMATMLSFYVRDTMGIDEPGVACVDAHTMTTYVSACKGTISAYETKAGRLMLKGRSNKLSLAQIPDDHFPRHPEVPDDVFARVKGKDLRELLTISRMGDQKNITSALAGTLLAAEDGRLASMAASQGKLGYSWAEAEVSTQDTFLIPPSTALLLPILLYNKDDVAIYTHGNKLFFVTDRFQLISNELHGDFPYNQAKVMANAELENEILVSNRELNSALSTCMNMLKNTNEVRWKKLTFSADTPYKILDVSTAEENEVGQLNWVVPIVQDQKIPFEFDLYSDFGWDIVSMSRHDEADDVVAQMLGAPSVSIGYIRNNNNLLVRFSTRGSKSMFIMSPLGKIRIGNDG